MPRKSIGKERGAFEKDPGSEIWWIGSHVFLSSLSNSELPSCLRKTSRREETRWSCAGCDVAHAALSAASQADHSFQQIGILDGRDLIATTDERAHNPTADKGSRQLAAACSLCFY